MKRKGRARKAAVTAVGKRSQRGSHGDGSHAGTTFDPRPILALLRRNGLVIPRRQRFTVPQVFGWQFTSGADDSDRINDPALPASQQIIDLEAKT